jgi:PAS domain S-box-containing protein
MAETSPALRWLRRDITVSVPAVYVAVAAVYIVVSDLLVHDTAAGSMSELYASLAKGLAFVVVTGLLLHLLLRFAFVPATQHRAAVDAHIEMLDALPNVFLEIDGKGDLTGWNGNTVRLTGMAAEDLRQRPASSLVVESDRAAFEDAMQRLRVSASGHTFDARLRRADGGDTRYAWHAAPRGAPAGAMDGGATGATSGAYIIGVDVSPTATIHSALSNAVSGERTILRQSIEAIAHTLELRDPYTSGHQTHVAELSVAIGRRLALPDDRLEGLRYGALLHDLGKIAVPGELLTRSIPLDPLEMEMIRHHTRRGHDVLSHIDFPWPIADVALHHHERLDGSGYPDGLAGEAISLEARIVGVADVVHAMSLHRPYRAALGIDRALAEIRDGAGKLYDAAIVDACIGCFDAGFAFTPVTGAASGVER